MRVIIFTILFSFILLVSASYAQNNNRVVAFVNNEVITLYELNSKILEWTGKTSEELKSEDEEQFFSIRSEVLDLMINNILEQEKAREYEISVTNEEIDTYIEYFKESNKLTQEELLAELEKSGVNFAKYRIKIKEDLIRRKLLGREIREKTVITDDKIAKFYEENKNEFEKPGKAHIASIFLVPETSGSQDELDKLKKTGDEILSLLKKGESFADLAKKYSNGPGAEEGGDLGDIPLTDVDPKILDVINSLKTGEVSSVVNMDRYLQIIKLISKLETGYVPLKEVEDRIHEYLSNQEVEKRYKDYIEELKEASYIKKVL